MKRNIQKNEEKVKTVLYEKISEKSRNKDACGDTAEIIV